MDIILGNQMLFDDFDSFDDNFDSFNDDFGTRKKNHDVIERPQGSSDQQNDVYVVNSVNEYSLMNYSFIQRLIYGYSLQSDCQYSIGLVREGSVGHGGSGVNAIVQGKMEFNNLMPGSRVRVSGRYKKGLLYVHQIVDANSQMPIRINKFWKDPMRRMPGARYSSSHMGTIIAAIILLIALYYVVTSLFPAVFQNLDLLLGIVCIIAFLYLFRGDPTIRKIIVIILAILAFLYLPGGANLAVCALILFGIYWMLKSIL